MTEIVVRVIDCHIFCRKNNEPQFLLLKRSDDQIYPGIWQCVTGKIEPGEKPYQTAIREVREETGMSPVSMWTVEQVNHYYEARPDRMNLIPIFGIEVDKEDIQLSSEHTAYRWCHFDEGKDLLFWDQQKNGLRSFYKMLITNQAKLDLTEIPI